MITNLVVNNFFKLQIKQQQQQQQQQAVTKTVWEFLRISIVAIPQKVEVTNSDH